VGREVAAACWVFTSTTIGLYGGLACGLAVGVVPFWRCLLWFGVPPPPPPFRTPLRFAPIPITLEAKQRRKGEGRRVRVPTPGSQCADLVSEKVH
jgi:hypothetical protein